VVPRLLPTIFLLKFPPHAEKLQQSIARMTSIPSIVLHLLRRAGIPKSRTQANAAPLAGYRIPLRVESATVVPEGTVVVTMRVAVSADVPEMLTTLVEPKLNVGELTTPLGLEVMDAVSVTFPVKPPDGVTVMVEVFAVVAPAVIVTGVLVRAKLELPAGAQMVSAMVVYALIVPEVPVMVTVVVPIVAVLAAAKVTTLEPVVGLVPNVAVTSVGRPVAASVTLLANPFRPVTITVSVPLLPWVTDTAEAVGARVKLSVDPPAEGELTVSVMVVVWLSVPEVPVIVTVEVPVAALLLAVKVTTLLPVVGLVPNATVTPEGNPDAARVTLPAKLFKSVTLIVSVLLLPCVTESVAAVGAMV